MFYVFHQEDDEAAANISVTYRTRNYHDLPQNQAGFSERTGRPRLHSGQSSSKQERFRKPIHLFREIFTSFPDSILFSDEQYICVEIYLSPDPFIKFTVPCSIKYLESLNNNNQTTSTTTTKLLSWQLLVWMKSFNCYIFKSPRKITSKIDVLWQKSLRCLKTRTNRKHHH